MHKFGVYLGGAILICLLVAGFVAYFVASFDPDTGQWFDGFGRSLTESPWLMRFIFDLDRRWIGWFWFVGDMIIFWGGIAIAFAFMNLGQGDRKKAR